MRRREGGIVIVVVVEYIHRHPAACLVIVRHLDLRLHGLLADIMPDIPRGAVREIIDLDRIIIARRGDLPVRVPRSVADAQPALVLAQQGRQAPVGAAGDLAQVPQLEHAVERGRGEQVRVRRVQREAADLLVG